MRAMWTGSLGFGLVMVPVRLFKATEPRTSDFHLVHIVDGSRIRMAKVCLKCEKELTEEELGRGIDLGDGTTQPLTDSDTQVIEGAKPDKNAPRTAEIQHFTTEGELDPVMFSGDTYYVEPGKGGEGGYTLLREAMRDTGLVGVAKITIRDRESLAVLRVHDQVLMLTKLVYPQEVRVPDFPFLRSTASKKTSPKEEDMAKALVSSMADSFDASAHPDTYRAVVAALVEAKTSGTTAPTPAVKAPPASDVLATALAASLAAATKSVKAGKSKASAKKGA